MEEQQAAVAGEADLGGTMRLGAYPATLQEGSVVAAAYGATEVSERHRHPIEAAQDGQSAHQPLTLSALSTVFSSAQQQPTR